MKNKFKFISLGTAVYLLFPQSGYCYIDPGTGSFMLQILISAFLGLLYSIKLFWKKITAVLLLVKAFIISKVV
jgi:hypothetical protein